MTTLSTSWTKLNDTSVSYGPWTGNFALWAIITSTDVANNRTKVKFSWDLTTTAGYQASSYDAQDYVTGAGWNSATYRTYSGSGTLIQGEVWINHNADGTKSDSCSGRTYMGGIGVDTGWVSADFDLPRIPRASVPTASPNPATVGANGVTVTINTNRKSSSFTHTVSLTCGSWSWSSSARGVGASVAVAIPYSVIAQFSATSRTATCTISCTTFNGTTNIGTKTATFTLQTDTSVDHPNIGTITVEDTNSRTSSIVGAETFIYGISTLTATIPLTVSGSYTQLASAVVTCGTRSQTYTLSGTSQTLTFVFDKVNAPSLTVTVKDKRGNSVSKAKTYTLMAYQPETVTGTVGRVTATGSTAVGQVSGVAYGGNYGQASNSLTVTYKYKEHDSSTWTDSTYSATLSLNEGQQTYTHAITLLEAFDYQKQYDIQFIVNDLFNTATYTAQLMQGLPILSWDETEVDVWGDLHIHSRENPYVWQDVMEGFDAVFANYGQKNLLPITATGTTVHGITYTVKDGTITANGTADANSVILVGTAHVPSGSYIASGASGGTIDTYYLQINYLDSGGTAHTGVATIADDTDWITPSDYGGTTQFYIVIRSGQTVSNLEFKPMLRDARIASDTFVQSAIQTAMVNITGKSSRAQLFKFGKVVFFTSPSDGTYSSGLNNIGTIPTGYRPAAEVRIPIGNDARNTRFIIIQTTGAIHHYANNSASSNSNYGFTACWITYE